MYSRINASTYVNYPFNSLYSSTNISSYFFAFYYFYYSSVVTLLISFLFVDVKLLQIFCNSLTLNFNTISYFVWLSSSRSWSIYSSFILLKSLLSESSSPSSTFWSHAYSYDSFSYRSSMNTLPWFEFIVLNIFLSNLYFMTLSIIIKIFSFELLKIIWLKGYDFLVW